MMTCAVVAAVLAASTAAVDGAAVVRKAVDDAIGAGRREAVVREDLEFSSSVALPSDFTLVLDGCRLTMADGSMDNFFTSTDTRNVAILGRNGAVLDGARMNGLTEKTSMKGGMPHVRKNCPVLFVGVKGFRVSGLTVRNHRYWGLTFCYCSDGVVSDIEFDARHDRNNQDGIDLRNGCHHVVIERISGQTGDDMIALSAIDWKNSSFYREGECHDIHHVEIRDVRGAAHNHPLVAMRNSNGARLYDVSVKGVANLPFGNPCRGGEMPRYALVRIGNNMYFAERPSAPGETRGIVLEDLDTGYSLRGVVLAAAVDDLVVRNLRGWGVCRTLVTTDGPKWAGPPGVKATNVRVENCVLESDMPGAMLFDFDRMREGDFTNGFVAVGCELRPSAAPRHESEPEWAPRRVSIPSTKDGTWQSFYAWAPDYAGGEGVPLLVALHTWSYDMTAEYPGKAMLEECRRRGWAFLYPNFRGPNRTPKACGSPFAVQDILDAVEWAKAYWRIDRRRVYAVGSSGGGHMALLLAGTQGSRPDCPFAAVAAFCPISDLALWHSQSRVKPGSGYWKMMEAACGGPPEGRGREYALRSPVTFLPAATNVAVYVATGIHDGHIGSVPVGHAVRAFNALAAPGDAISEEDIGFIERNRRVPDGMAFEGYDPFYPPKKRIYLRRRSGNAMLTLFEGGHSSNLAAAIDFLSRQENGNPADWTLPAAAGSASLESVSK